MNERHAKSATHDYYAIHGYYATHDYYVTHVGQTNYFQIMIVHAVGLNYSEKNS